MIWCYIWSFWLSVTPIKPSDSCSLALMGESIKPMSSFAFVQAVKRRNVTSQVATKSLTDDMIFFSPPLARTFLVTSGYGLRKHPILGRMMAHNGADFATPVGTTVMAVASGVISDSGYDRRNGFYLVLQHADGWFSRYLHLSDITVERGSSVEAGAAIARTGNTGLSTGPHLHLEIGYRDVPLDPLALINAGNSPSFFPLQRYSVPAMEHSEIRPKIVLITESKGKVRVSVKWNERKVVVTPGSVVFEHYRVIRNIQGRYILVMHS